MSDCANYGLRVAGCWPESVRIAARVSQRDAALLLADGAAVTLAACGSADDSAGGKVTLLNVSYDPTRELYRDFNENFVKEWQARTGRQSRSSNRTADRAARRAR